MSLLSKLAKIVQTFREANERQVLAPPALTYESVFDFVRQSCKGWVYDHLRIEPHDELITRDLLGPDDVSYFIDDLQKSLRLDIPQSEWDDIRTFDDLTRLLLKHLELRSERAGA